MATAYDLLYSWTIESPRRMYVSELYTLDNAIELY